MTVAWYGHLRFKNAALLTTVLVSWLIALPERGGPRRLDRNPPFLCYTSAGRRSPRF
jgi:putative drug/metabolite transporter DUF486